MARGKLISIEGLDGAGKTTLIAALSRVLSEQGIKTVVLREPGGVDLSERIRTLVKDPDIQIHPRAEALLYAAARAQLVHEMLNPLLDSGQWVLLDRFIDSSLAYQGAGRDLGVSAIQAINEFGSEGLQPDRTLLLRIDPSEGLERIADREQDIDRLEHESEAFFVAVSKAYDKLAAADSQRFSVLDAGEEPKKVLQAAVSALQPLLS